MDDCTQTSWLNQTKSFFGGGELAENCTGEFFNWMQLSFIFFFKAVPIFFELSDVDKASFIFVSEVIWPHPQRCSQTSLISIIFDWKYSLNRETTEMVSLMMRAVLKKKVPIHFSVQLCAAESIYFPCCLKYFAYSIFFNKNEGLVM